MRQISKVIFHCADTPDYEIGQKHFDLIGAKEIDLWHKQRKFQKIGYHWVIRRSGVIEPGRSEDEIGAHCVGHNHDSIGICFVGSKIMTQFQIISVKTLYLDIKKRHGIDFYGWYTHNFFNPKKTCPNMNIDVLRDSLSKFDIT